MTGTAPERLRVPEPFARSILSREGDGGRRWLDALPRTVAELCRRWGLRIDGEPMHGWLAVVVPVRRGSEPLVLKVAWPDEYSDQEALALETWGGDGAVRLVAVDRGRNALLLERLDPGRTLAGEPVEEATAIAARLLRRLAVPAPPGVPPVAEEAAKLVDGLPRRWEGAGKPFGRELLEEARRLAGRLGASPTRLVIDHDLHYENVLAGEREPWLVIDPKVMAGDPEFGVAPLLWNRFDELGGRPGLEERLGTVAEEARLDPVAARGWALVRIVDYWLWALEERLTTDPVRCRALVDWLR